MENYKSPDISLDDIVFEGRNKSYGAYFLRKIYNDHVVKCLLFGALVVSAGIAAPFFLLAIRPVEEEVLDTTPVELKNIEPPPIDPNTPPPPPPPAAPPPPKISTIKYVPPVVAPDEEVVEPDPPKQEEMKEVAISTETVEGDLNADPNLIIEEPSAGTLIGEPATEETIFQVVEQMPEFEGGQSALYKYLGKNIKYPAQARNGNIQGTVFVGFVVASDGKIKDVQVLKGIGYGCDEEAVRVVSTMPAWRPGKQSGRPVSVRYSLPIKFTLQQ